MSNIIALVWDFDKTLVDGYMQDPIFEKYDVVSKDYWRMINNLPQKYKEEQDVEVNKDTIYLNQFGSARRFAHLGSCPSMGR